MLSMYLGRLPDGIKKIIALYLRTPAADLIQLEIQRILPIVKRDKLYTEQTIWSVMTIEWYDYYTENHLRYRQDTKWFFKENLLTKYELQIAKHKHNLITGYRALSEIHSNHPDYYQHLRFCHSTTKTIDYIEEIYEKEYQKYIEYLQNIEYIQKFYDFN